MPLFIDCWWQTLQRKKEVVEVDEDNDIGNFDMRNKTKHVVVQCLKSKESFFTNIQISGRYLLKMVNSILRNLPKYKFWKSNIKFMICNYAIGKSCPTKFGQNCTFDHFDFWLDILQLGHCM